MSQWKPATAGDAEDCIRRIVGMSSSSPEIAIQCVPKATALHADRSGSTDTSPFPVPTRTGRMPNVTKYTFISIIDNLFKPLGLMSLSGGLFLNTTDLFPALSFSSENTDQTFPPVSLSSSSLLSRLSNA